MNTVLYVNDGSANIWTRDYVKRQPQARNSVAMPSGLTARQTADAIGKAAKMAGANGTLIFNLGHGGTSTSGDAKEGFVDLAPGKKMRLGGHGQTDTFISVFYDVNVAGPPSVSDMANDTNFNAGTPGAKTRQQHWKIYQSIGAAIKAAGLYRILFLTCKVGNSTDFVKKIANDWGVVVTAPKQRVVLTPQKNQKVRIQLEGVGPNFGTNVPESEQEVMVLTNVNSYSAAPPLKAA